MAARYLQRKLDPLSCPEKVTLKDNVPGVGVIVVMYSPPDGGETVLVALRFPVIVGLSRVVMVKEVPETKKVLPLIEILT
jgi:hypothetical protein